VTLYRGYLECPRCGHRVEEDGAFDGCPVCARAGWSINVHPVYDLTDVDWPAADLKYPGIFRWHRLLPLVERTKFVSLNEGSTPLLPALRLGHLLGMDRLYVKDESRNPTWSYKDRLVAVAVNKAQELGADTIVLSSTGNQGAAAAAYAALAGLRCVVFTLESVPLTMKLLMQSYGAEVIALRSGPQRWTVMSEAIAEWGWMPISGFRDPPIGSNPFGIDGYKTIAYEIVQDLGAAPEVLFIPAAYGDGLAGIQRGFEDLMAIGVIARGPRLIAAEPLGAYRAALADNAEMPVRVESGSTVAFSTATPIGTYQGLRAIRASSGDAQAVGDDSRILAAQKTLASQEGLYMEPSAALALAALEGALADRTVGHDEVVVLLGTSTGLKDVQASSSALPEVPVIEPSLSALSRVLGDRPS